MEHVLTPVTKVVNFLRAKGPNHLQIKAFLEERGSAYADVPNHTEVRWLSRGKVLNGCFQLREQMCLFLESKGKDSRGGQFLCERAFLCDITSSLNVLIYY